jgi:tetratricopeptide (TPR) repeat protein
LGDLERFLVGTGDSKQNAVVAAELLEPNSHLAKLVDRLGDMPLIPAALFDFHDDLELQEEMEGAGVHERSWANDGMRRFPFSLLAPWIVAWRGRDRTANGAIERADQPSLPVPTSLPRRRFAILSAAATAGGVALAWTLVSNLMEPPQALAAIEEQLRQGQVQLDGAVLLIDQEDYGEAESKLIALRAALADIPATSVEHQRMRRRIDASAWALQAIALGQHGSFDAAQLCLERAVAIVDGATERDRLLQAYCDYAAGKVEFQKIHGLKAKKEERRQRLLVAERHLRAALRAIQGQLPRAADRANRASDVPRFTTSARTDASKAGPSKAGPSKAGSSKADASKAGSSVVRSSFGDAAHESLLAARILVTLAAVVHKLPLSAAESAKWEDSLRLCDEAETLLIQHEPTPSSLAWLLLSMQVTERRGLSLVSLGRESTAARQYGEAIDRLSAHPEATQLTAVFQIGMLYGNQADALMKVGDLPGEIAARSAAIERLQQFWLHRPTQHAFVNLRLHRARRALARFEAAESLAKGGVQREAERAAAMDDVVAFRAISPTEGDENDWAQLASHESLRLHLLAAVRQIKLGASPDVELHGAERRLAAALTESSGLSLDRQRRRWRPYLDLSELAGHPSYEACRTRIVASLADLPDSAQPPLTPVD